MRCVVGEGYTSGQNALIDRSPKRTTLMKKASLIYASLPVLLFAVGNLKAEETPVNPDIAEAKLIVAQFAGQLQSELKAAIDNGGPVMAIDVCSKRAPAIAAGLSKSTGWEVGRTSLATRNPELNTPDRWEVEVLEQFDARQAAGEDVKTMAHAEVVETDGDQRFRFMKAVPTGALCLACHGSEVTAEVATALDEHYPEDEARGYALGDVRGAFSLSKPL